MVPKVDFPNAELLEGPKPDWPKIDCPDAFASNPLFPKADKGFGASIAVGVSLEAMFPNPPGCELRMANAPKPVAGLITLTLSILGCLLSPEFCVGDTGAAWPNMDPEPNVEAG